MRVTDGSQKGLETRVKTQRASSEETKGKPRKAGHQSKDVCICVMVILLCGSIVHVVP